MEARVYDYFAEKFNGTHLQGYVGTTFAKLQDLLGEGMGGGDKTTQEWCIEFSDGTVATIYDWKEYGTPMGHYDWHIGGTERRAVQLVEDLLAGRIMIVETFEA
jgi:hypothetical protein